MRELTPAEVRKIHDDLKKLFKIVEDKHGVKIGNGGVKYDATSFWTKLTVRLIGEGDEDKSATDIKYGNDYMEIGHLYFQIPPKREHIGTIFTSNGKRYQFKGVNSRSHKYPIMTKCLTNGKGTKFTDDIISTIKKKFK